MRAEMKLEEKLPRAAGAGVDVASCAGASLTACVGDISGLPQQECPTFILEFCADEDQLLT